MDGKKGILRQLTEDSKLGIALSRAQNNPVPENYKMGRDVLFKFGDMERDFFKEAEERASGFYIVRGLERKLTETTFQAFCFAVGQTLYNQSYQSGNEDINSGISKRESKQLARPGEKHYFGEIVTTLNDLCRLAYGVDEPSTQMKKEMDSLIETIDRSPVKITMPNGDTLESKICARMDVYTRAKDGAKTYRLFTHPLFSSNVKKNFGLFPQDLTKRLSEATERKTAAHYRLIALLGRQDARKPFIRTAEQLLNDLGLLSAYKAQKGRTVKLLISIFDSMKEVGLITRYEIEYMERPGRKTKTPSKFTFTLNEGFAKTK